MRELIKKEQLVTIVPQDFKNSNKGKVLEVSLDGFRMELKYKPTAHVCTSVTPALKLGPGERQARARDRRII